MAKMAGGKAVATLLKEYGVGYVFGMPGGQTYPIYVGIHDLVPAIQHVLFGCEKCAAFAADAYARVTGRPGVCDGTVGPGATNMVSAVGEAWGSSIPLIVITGDVHTWQVGKSAAQECDMITMLKPFVKASFYVNRTDKIPEIVRKAFRIATTGRPGAVHLDFPADVIATAMDFGQDLYAEKEYSVFPAKRLRPNLEDVRKAADAILEVERPVIFAGGGVITSQAWEEVIELAELLAIPIATSVMGKGTIPEDHPLSLGAAMTIYEPEAVLYLRGGQLLAEADLVIFIGHKTDQSSTADWHVPPPGTKAIHIDVDPAEIGRNYPVIAGIVGDAKLAVRNLIEAIEPKITRRPLSEMPRTKETHRMISEWRKTVAPRLNSDEVPITAARVVKELREVMDKDAILVCDASLATLWGAHYFDVLTSGRTFLAGRGLAGIGYGVPAVIGAKLATPDKQVVGLGGDGGFAMAIHEMETMKRLRLPVVYVVLNNSALGYLHKGAINAGLPVVSCEFSPLNYAKIAKAFGLYAARVEWPRDIQKALVAAINSDRPVIVDVVTAVEFGERAGGMVVS